VPTEVRMHAEYVAEAARQMIFSQYGDEAYTRGLNVYLTLRSAEQIDGLSPLRKGVMDFERRQVYIEEPRPTLISLANPKELDARIAESFDRPPRQRRTPGRSRASGRPTQSSGCAAKRRVDRRHG